MFHMNCTEVAYPVRPSRCVAGTVSFGGFQGLRGHTVS